MKTVKILRGLVCFSDPGQHRLDNLALEREHVLVLASAWTALILRLNRGNGITQAALVAAGNLLVNLAFFMSHPVFTPYYTIPVAMLSLWSLLFAGLMQPAEAVEGDFLGRPARA
jgi:hypothetical protein